MGMALTKEDRESEKQENISSCYWNSEKKYDLELNCNESSKQNETNSRLAIGLELQSILECIQYATQSWSCPLCGCELWLSVVTKKMKFCEEIIMSLTYVGDMKGNSCTWEGSGHCLMKGFPGKGSGSPSRKTL